MNIPVCVYINIPYGQSKMDNPEKLATYMYGTKDDKQNKNTTQYVLDTTRRTQTQIT